MNSDEYLQMSGIQHFAFCRRQWALAYLEQQWSENLRTAEGHLLHERCHDETLREKRGDRLIVRGMRVISQRLRLSGVCDVVEFQKTPLVCHYRDKRGSGCRYQWSINADLPRKMMRIVCSFVRRQWLWRKCLYAIFQGEQCFMRKLIGVRLWN